MEDLSLSLRDGEWQSLIIRICIFVVMVECFREKTKERDETRERESDELGNQRRVCIYEGVDKYVEKRRRETVGRAWERFAVKIPV